MKKRFSDLTIEDLQKRFPDIPVEVVLGVKYSLVIEGKRFPFYSILKEVFCHENSGTLVLMILRLAMTAAFTPRWIIHKLRGQGAAYANKVMHTWARAECWMSRTRLTVIDHNVYDPSRTYLFVVNHQSPMDIPAIHAALRCPAGFVANSDFKRIPVFNFWMRETGSVFVHQGTNVLDLKALKRLVASLKSGHNLIIFPEGGMSTFRDVQAFSRAGIAAAVMAGAMIVPVGISGTPDVFPPGEFYVNTGKAVVVTFGAPIETAGLSRSNRNELTAMVRQQVIDLKAAGDSLIARQRKNQQALRSPARP